MDARQGQQFGRQAGGGAPGGGDDLHPAGGGLGEGRGGAGGELFAVVEDGAVQIHRNETNG